MTFRLQFYVNHLGPITDGDWGQQTVNGLWLATNGKVRGCYCHLLTLRLGYVSDAELAALQREAELPQFITTPLPLDAHTARLEIAAANKREIPFPDTGQWLVGCTVLGELFKKTYGRRCWTIAANGLSAPIKLRANYGVDKVDNGGQLSMPL